MTFSSPENIETRNCLGLEILVFDVDDEYVPSFSLILPSGRAEIDVEEFQALISGLKHAVYKLETLVEKLENE